MKRNIVFLIDHMGYQEIYSIPLLSAIAKRDHHNVLLVEYGGNSNDALDEIKSFKPDIIAYSICSAEAPIYLKINQFLKQNLKFFSLFGGSHPTFFPSFIEEEGVDAICRGEGDIVLPMFLNHFPTDRMYDISNFSFKIGGEVKMNPITSLVDDLDNLPYPDRALLFSKSYFLAQNPIKTFFAGRGCPYNCSYCFNHAYNALYEGKGKILRTKSVDYFLGEIKSVSREYPLEFVKIHDDIFGANKEWLAEFAERYPKEINLPFLSYSRPNMVTEEYAKTLRKAGCFSVTMAIEVGNKDLRKKILNRNLSDEEILRACANFKKVGIRIFSLNMVGLPGETEKDIMMTIDINRHGKVDFADASIFQPYPGTEITKYCHEHGYLDKENNTFESQYTSSILNFDEKFKNKLFVLHRLFAILVDFPGAKFFLPFFFKKKSMRYLLNLVYRFYYGLELHRRIYDFKIPLLLQLRGASRVIFSRNRN